MVRLHFDSGENNLSLKLAIFLASRSREEQGELYKTFGDAIGKYKKAEIAQYQKDMEEMRQLPPLIEAEAKKSLG
jgi:hypothetical protein